MITSTRLGCDVWLIDDPAFKPGDGLAWYYPEEMGIIGKKDDEELRQIQAVKLAFPGAKVTDRQFGAFPDLPWRVTYTQAEIIAFEQYWVQKYPKEAGSFFKSEHSWHGLIGEDCFERFLKATPLPWTRLSKGEGPDKADFQVGAWIIDVKTESTGAALYLDDLWMSVLREQVEKEGSPINTYQWAIYNPEIRQCSLYGWRAREDLRLQEDGGLAVFREAGVKIPKRFTPEWNLHEIRFRQTHSEQRYIWDFKGETDGHHHNTT